MPATVLIKPKKPANGNSAMDVRHINPFIIAAVNVIRQNTGLHVAKENIFVQKGKFIPSGTGMYLNITGGIDGRIVYEFSKGVAVKLSQKMVEQNIDMQLSAIEFKKMLNAAILELGNQIAGKAITLLEENGVNCSISAPRFFIGQDMQLIHPHMRTIVLNLRTDAGPMSINIAMNG